MTTNTNKRMIATVLMLVVLVLVTLGASYAFLAYAKKGSVENTITTGKLSFVYDEKDASGNGINMTNVLPTSDANGKMITGSNNVFDFQIVASTVGETITYEIVAEKQSSSTLAENMVKLYLTTVDGDVETPTETTNKNNVVTTYSELIDSSMVGQTGKTIYQEIINPGEKNYVKQFRLRMWLSENASNQTGGSWDYSNQSFSLKVNVIASGEKTTPPPTIPTEPNKPELDAGMIPVYYDGNTLKKADTTTEWYNYDNKKWANAILVTEGSRATYQNAVGGTVINTSDVLAYFVWIPRYRYQLFNVEGVESTAPQEVKIIFEDKNTPKSTGTTNGSYVTPPGFTFGTQELNGFWVGKFETTGDTTKPTILPNVASLTNQTVSTLFETNQKFKTNAYGLSLESKMMKNSEWGAVAYLSHSKYGVNTEVRINNYWDNTNLKTRTGCGASADNASSVPTCDIVYGQASAYPQSTTGNITGIFDMSGAGYEYVMGVLADSSGKPRSGNNVLGNSGYTGALKDGSIYNGKSIPEAKYYNLYKGSNYANYCDGLPCLGQALIETDKWYQDSNSVISENGPWILRGGAYNVAISAGLFNFNSSYGGAYMDNTSRAVVVPSN